MDDCQPNLVEIVHSSLSLLVDSSGRKEILWVQRTALRKHCTCECEGQNDKQCFIGFTKTVYASNSNFRQITMVIMHQKVKPKLLCIKK